MKLCNANNSSLWNANMQLHSIHCTCINIVGLHSLQLPGTVYWQCLARTGYMFCGTLVCTMIMSAWWCSLHHKKIVSVCKICKNIIGGSYGDPGCSGDCVSLVQGPITCLTVEPLLMDTLNCGHPLYNGHVGTPLLHIIGTSHFCRLCAVTPKEMCYRWCMLYGRCPTTS